MNALKTINAEDVSINPSFSWTCTDPDGDNITYEFKYKLGGLFEDWNTIATPNNSYDLTDLIYGEDYYWKVFAYDEHGELTQSHANTQSGWKFSTNCEIINIETVLTETVNNAVSAGVGAPCP